MKWFSSSQVMLHKNDKKKILKNRCHTKLSKSNLEIHDLRNVSSNISDFCMIKITVQDLKNIYIERHNKE